MEDPVFEPGDALGSYRVVELIGSGGFANVYLATHVDTGERVALKCLKARHSMDRRMREKMAAEAALLSRLRHPNVVRVYEAGTSDGTVWMAMELLEGRSLRDALTQAGGPLPFLEATFIAAEIAAGVAAAHDYGVIHRDLKPENVMLVDFDVKVLDMGAAKFLGWGLETTGAMPTIGTVLYMAPEHIRRGRIDVRTDVYALGLILFEMCAGRHPFFADWDDMPSAAELPRMQLHVAPPRLVDVSPKCPVLLALLAERAMNKDPDHRFRTMRAFEDALRGMGERIMDDEERGVQPPAEPEKRSGFQSGARAIFANVGTAALGGVSTPGFPSRGIAAGVRSTARVLLDADPPVDLTAETKEMLAVSPAGILTTEPLGPGPFPSPGPPPEAASAGAAEAEPEDLSAARPAAAPAPSVVPAAESSAPAAQSPPPKSVRLEERGLKRRWLILVPMLIAIGAGLLILLSVPAVELPGKRAPLAAKSALSGRSLLIRTEAPESEPAQTSPVVQAPTAASTAPPPPPPPPPTASPGVPKQAPAPKPTHETSTNKRIF